jgi:hypothetical protein
MHKRPKVSSLEQLEKNQEKFVTIPKAKNEFHELSKKDIDNNKRLIKVKYKEKEDELNYFLKECITCNHCNNTYSLRENKITLCCNGCEKFYCCGISGECEGRWCKVLINNNICRLRYCIQCSYKILKLGKTCICKKCK